MSRRRAAPELIATAGELTVLRDRERPSGRLLRQGEMDASYVDLADVRHLEFDYLRRMRDVVLATGARRVVHVGGAGCALARALAAAEPAHRQEVIELDGEVVELARRHLGLRRARGLRVRVGDGRALLARRPDRSADAVLIDAFVGARVPRHLVTAEALADLARVAGLAAVNVVDSRAMGDASAIAGPARRVPVRDRAGRRAGAGQAAQRQRGAGRRARAAAAGPPARQRGGRPRPGHAAGAGGDRRVHL